MGASAGQSLADQGYPQSQITWGNSSHFSTGTWPSNSSGNGNLLLQEQAQAGIGAGVGTAARDRCAYFKDCFQVQQLALVQAAATVLSGPANYNAPS